MVDFRQTRDALQFDIDLVQAYKQFEEGDIDHAKYMEWCDKYQTQIALYWPSKFYGPKMLRQIFCAVAQWQLHQGKLNVLFMRTLLFIFQLIKSLDENQNKNYTTNQNQYH